MTEQAAEILFVAGHEFAMDALPLDDYFSQGGHNPGFVFESTDLWRGYVGTWEIADNQLYLIKLEGTLDDGSAASPSRVFRSQSDRVPAWWYSGTLRAPVGDVVGYTSGLWRQPRYAQELVIEVRDGVAVTTLLRDLIGGKELPFPSGSTSHEAPQGF